MDDPALTTADLDFLHWWGMPTLYRCAHESDRPRPTSRWSGSRTARATGLWRDQHLGPRAFRDLSMGYQRLHLDWQFNPWSACRIRDLGDVPILETLVNDRAVREIERYFTAIDRAGCRPVSIGGDHSIIRYGCGSPRVRVRLRWG